MDIRNTLGGDYFYQWDSNQTLTLSDDLANIATVHYENPDSDVAYMVDVVNGVANVPNILLQKASDIIVWVYIDEESRTMFSKTFKVYARQKPSGYVYTETEVLTYRKLDERLTDVEKVIDVMQTTTSIPAKGQRGDYKIPFIKPVAGGGDPDGGNFTLEDLLNAEATQEELDAKVDKTTYNADKATQATKDSEQDTRQDTFESNHQLYVLGLKPKNLATYLGATGATPEAICKDAFAKLKARVVAGNFDGLNLGDYIYIPTLNLPEVPEQQEVLDDSGNIVTPYMEHEDAVTLTSSPSYTNQRVQIVSFNHYRSIGSATNIRKPHIVMEFAGIPCMHWFNRKVKNPLPPDTDGTVPTTPDPWNYKHWDYSTKGDYNKSQLRAWLEKCFGPALIEAIGFDPLPIDRMIATVNSWAWCGAEKVFIPTNLEILGDTGWASRANGYASGTSRQYPLHALNPSTIMHDRNGSRYYYWLAETQTGSSVYFCYVYRYGFADHSGAFHPCGVAPAFLIG